MKTVYLIMIATFVIGIVEIILSYNLLSNETDEWKLPPRNKLIYSALSLVGLGFVTAEVSKIITKYNK